MTTPIPTIDEIRTAWDAIASRFDEHITPVSSRQGEQVLERLDLGSGTRLLDVACGSGALAIPAARRGAEVTAVDISPAMIDLLAARARAEGVRVNGRVMDHHALDLPDDAFDVTVSQHGVTMSPQLDVVLAELARVTRPGGTIAVTAFGPLPKVEFLSTFIAAARAAVPGFAGPPLDPPPPPFQLANRETFAHALIRAGLHNVTIDTATWNIPVVSSTDLWDEVTSSNPIGAQLVANINEAQRSELLKVLDGVLRERFDGRPDGILPAEVNIGIGTVRGQRGQGNHVDRAVPQ